MADDDRFRKLSGASKGPARDRTEPRTPDLFAHFGIAVEEPVAPGATTVAVEAAACHRCAWYLAYRRAESSCPICGELDPLKPRPGTQP